MVAAEFHRGATESVVNISILFPLSAGKILPSAAAAKEKSPVIPIPTSLYAVTDPFTP